ncbi:hypothetical protein BC938DRAFT_481238 [Jimgerdemannia flammicorona]|uniref:Uncharacterized protein n=1 Tax=Jimgerdemannia flammicorona TaxID=994334 RepID=A0A433QGN8_9FUNG|nr:hypothetical protein BC938DRAFT_481238 [Jimgerdemannia flammicorona]
MSTGNITLWVKLEDQRQPVQHRIHSGSNLADFAGHLCQTSKRLKTLDVDLGDIEFFGDYDKAKYSDDDRNDQNGHDKSLFGEILVEHLKTTSKSPLVVRYPLSNKAIVLNLKLLRTQIQVTLTHSTGTWRELLAQTRNKFDRLQEGAEFYFVDQETKKMIIEDKVTFDRLLNKTAPNDQNEVIVDLIVRIKDKLQHRHECSHILSSLTGKKAYGDWSLNEVLNEVLHKRYPSLLAMPELNIEQIKPHAKKNSLVMTRRLS